MIKINEALYEANVFERTSDANWDGRADVDIKMECSYENIPLTDGTPWSIVYQSGGKEVERDMSDFCVLGDITIHMDGHCTIKMGKLTDLELAYEMLLGEE